jgi:hypothetical protein
MVRGTAYSAGWMGHCRKEASKLSALKYCLNIIIVVLVVVAYDIKVVHLFTMKWCYLDW